MSSWFSSSAASVNIDEKIAQATSESIPLGDIDFAVALEIADLIRSKQVLPKDAMRSLKKRFMSKKENPNTQKSCLKLIDFCIKNGGEHFVIEISSKEFLDPFVVLLHETNLNETVKVYILELIQSWSIMFSTNPKLTYVNQIYTKLQKESFKFPQINSEIDSTLIESKVAPEWEDSDACMLCSTLFTFLNRKHHCRSCGGVFCGLHSSKSCELPELGINIPVRVCDSCFDEHKQKLDKIKASKNKNSKKHSHSHSRKVSFGKSSSTAIDEIDGDMDEDLKKAIELSLKESGVQVSKPRIPSISDTLSKHEDGDYDEDADMKAAIAASLSDFKQTPTSTGAQPQQQEQEQEQPQKQTSQYQEPSLYSNLLPQSNKSSNEIQYSVQPQQQQKLQQQNHVQPSGIQSNPNALTAIEEQNVILFTQLISNMNKIPVNQRQPIDLDLPLKNLYENILNLKPKSEKNIADEKSNLEKYQEMYSKLFAISRLYDDVLQSRLQRLSLSNDPNHYAQQLQQHQQQVIQQAYQQYYQQPYVDHNNQRYGQAVNSNSIPQSPQTVNNVAIPSPQQQQYQTQQQQHVQPQSTHSSFSLPTYLPPPADPQAFQAPNLNQQTAYAPSSPSVMAYNPSATPNAIALGSVEPQATGTPTTDISQQAPTPTTASAPTPTVSQPNIPAHTDAQVHEHQQTYAQPPSTQSQGVTQYAYSPAPPAYSTGISDRSPAPVPVQPHQIAQPGGPAVPTPTGEPAGIPPTTTTTATSAAIPAPIIPTATQQYEVPQPVPVARPEPPAPKVIDLIDL